MSTIIEKFFSGATEIHADGVVIADDDLQVVRDQLLNAITVEGATAELKDGDLVVEEVEGAVYGHKPGKTTYKRVCRPKPDTYTIARPHDTHPYFSRERKEWVEKEGDDTVYTDREEAREQVVNLADHNARLLIATTLTSLV